MTAVASAEVGLKYPDRIFVDGAWTQPATAARVDVFDSTTEQLLYQVADAQGTIAVRIVPRLIIAGIISPIRQRLLCRSPATAASPGPP